MAARKITLKFGLIGLAVKSEVAIDKPPSFTNLCVGQPGHEKHDPSPRRQPGHCDHCGEITDNTVLLKGSKQGSTYTLVEQEEVAEAKAEYAEQYKGELNLVPHPSADFMADTGPGKTLHYLTPADTSGEGHYQLLVQLVQSHPELAFASLYTPVSVTGLYMLRARDGVLLLEERTRSQALRPTPSVGGEVNDQLYSMLEAALAMFVQPYDASGYEDKYRTAVDAMLAEGEQVSVASEEPTALPLSPFSDADLITKLAALAKVA